MPATLPVIPRREGEYWTARQRQMHSLHYVVSYRAAFKPELPDYFIRKFTKAGQVVGDPFCGRGTTVLQANILGRYAYANDINPFAVWLTRTKTNPVPLSEVCAFLATIDWEGSVAEKYPPELLLFYHPKTLQELLILKKRIRETKSPAACFVALLAVSRLHGHSPGFFSVYTMPQFSVPPKAQYRINRKRRQVPEYRPVAPRLLAKAKAALQDNLVAGIRRMSTHNCYTRRDARALREWQNECIDLIVTSPPFLNKVDYITNNWLEHWFLDIDPETFRSEMLQTNSLKEWQDYMGSFLQEVARVLKPGGICVIEAGDVLYRTQKINLDEIIAAALAAAGCRVLRPVEVLVQRQNFSKIAHCFAVTNNSKGTNTQRMLVLQKK
ncbi:MAG TPA: site-specific DNA-methyltransferase [Firmicutes bacterium]|nr:site-specific DNA-methyltransferase [Bacillota bacterium]